MLVANDKAGMGRQDDALMKCVDVYSERDEGWVISHTFSAFLLFCFSAFLLFYSSGLLPSWIGQNTGRINLQKLQRPNAA